MSKSTKLVLKCQNAHAWAGLVKRQIKFEDEQCGSYKSGMTFLKKFVNLRSRHFFLKIQFKYDPFLFYTNIELKYQQNYFQSNLKNPFFSITYCCITIKQKRKTFFILLGPDTGTLETMADGWTTFIIWLWIAAEVDAMFSSKFLFTLYFFL